MTDLNPQDASSLFTDPSTSPGPRVSIPFIRVAGARPRQSGAVDAHDDNVAFLRSRVRSSPDFPSHSRQRRRRQHSNTEDESDQMELDDPESSRINVEITRHNLNPRRRRERPSDLPNYENHLPNVRSLYGWAPGPDDFDDTYEEVDDVDEQDEGRYHSISDSDDSGFSVPSIWINNRSTDRDGGRNASQRYPRISSRTGPQEATNTETHRLSLSAISTEALLQSVRRQSRLSRSRNMHQYLVERENAAHEFENRARLAASASRAYRYLPGGRVESHGDFYPSAIRPQMHSSRQAPPTHRRTMTQRHIQGGHQRSPRLIEIIRYLERLKYSTSYEESINAAAESGFLLSDFFSSNKADFVLETTSLAPPVESSWLRPGMVFSGSQCAANVSAHRLPGSHPANDPVIVNGSDISRFDVYTSGGRRYLTRNFYTMAKDQNWPVKVTIHNVDYKEMSLSGTMEAYNIPDKSLPNRDAHIITFLEGEIIDFNTHSLATNNFQADLDIDSVYWGELRPFKDMTDDEIMSNLVSRKWLSEELARKWILMRWKERCFITPTDARQGLTISGFYYISLRREDGHIEGLYYDPGSSPYQQLSLKPETEKMFQPSYGFR